MDPTSPVIDRLVAATNDHDLDRLVGCFAAEYVNETPAHPSRGFRGRAQVRRNWEQIFTFVPDVRAEVLRRVVDRGSVWTEWTMTGTRRDGSPHCMSGVIIFEVEDDSIVSARFYLEPRDEDDGSVDDAVSSQVVR